MTNGAPPLKITNRAPQLNMSSKRPPLNMTKRAPPLNMSSWDVYRYVYISICTVTDHSLSGNQVCSVWQCSCALVILVLIITIGNSCKAPFSNRAELTVLYKQLITTRTERTRNVFICCYRINQIYQTLSLSLTHTQPALYTSNNLFTFSRHPHLKKQKSFIIILQNYVTSHSASNFTNLCNVHFFPQLIHYFSHCHTPSFLPPTFDQPPVLGFVQFTIVAMTHPLKKKKKKILYTYNA